MQYILYNPINNLVFGITQNCYQNFGIPPSLVYGNSNNINEFTIKSIIPSIVDP